MLCISLKNDNIQSQQQYIWYLIKIVCIIVTSGILLSFICLLCVSYTSLKLNTKKCVVINSVFFVTNRCTSTYGNMLRLKKVVENFQITTVISAFFVILQFIFIPSRCNIFSE